MWNIKEWIVFVTSFLLLAVLTKTDAASWNDKTRMAAIQNIVEHQTFSIEGAHFSDTGDKVWINGKFYSDKPGPSYVIAVPIYFILYKCGITFSERPHLTYFLITLLTIGLSVGVMLVYFFRFLLRYELDDKKRFFYVYSLLLATLMLPYSTIFNANVLGSAFLFFSFYTLLNAKKTSHYVIAGVIAGFNATVDMVPGSFFLMFAVPLFFFPKRQFVKCLFYVSAALLPIAAYMANNFIISGSVIPFGMTLKFYQYPGSVWNTENLGGILTQPLSAAVKYAWDTVFGIKAGFLFYTPILYFSCLGLFLAISKKVYRVEGVILTLSLLASITFWTFKVNNYAGCSYGMRYTVSFIPILYSYTPLAFRLPNQRLVNCLKLLFFVILVLSFVFSWVGLMEPWTCNEEPNFFKLPIKELLIRIFRDSTSLSRYFL